MKKYTLLVLMLLLITVIPFEQGTTANGILDKTGSRVDWSDSDTSAQQEGQLLINGTRDTTGCDDFDRTTVSTSITIVDHLG